MNNVIMECCLPGCVSDDCIYRRQDTKKIEQQTGEKYWPRTEPFTVTTIIPHCAKEQKREQFRQSVFDDAWKSIEHIADSCNTLRGKLKAESIEWDKHARKWWDGPCLFYAHQISFIG